MFASYGNVIKAFKRGREVNTYLGHGGCVTNLIPFGEHLVSIDDQNCLKIWQTKKSGKMQQFISNLTHTHAYMHTHTSLSLSLSLSLSITHTHTVELYGEIHFDSESFQIMSVVHPSTYLNKVLLGSRQGQLQLWNIRTSKLIYTFAGWGSPVLCLSQSPAIDVVGMGLENGTVVIHNLKFDESLMKFHQEWGPVTALSFRTGESLLVEVYVV